MHPFSDKTILQLVRNAPNITSLKLMTGRHHLLAEKFPVVALPLVVKEDMTALRFGLASLAGKSGGYPTP